MFKGDKMEKMKDSSQRKELDWDRDYTGVECAGSSLYTGME